MLRRWLLLFLLPLTIFSDTCMEELMRDLKTVECVEERSRSDRLPLIYNYYGQVGTLALPSARAARMGELTGGYTYLYPYHDYFMTMQFFERMELSGIYRVFSGMQDDLLSPLGFGDFSDKGASVKFNFMLPEDTGFVLPGIAVGVNDFLGTDRFFGQYVVATQVLPDLNTEISAGIGFGYLHGIFGSAAITPMRTWCWPWNTLTFIGEYDPIDYEAVEPHLRGRKKSSKSNFGAQWGWNRWLRFAVSRWRGEVTTISGSLTWDIGTTQGFFPKVKNPCQYTAPANKQAMGRIRPKRSVIEEIGFALDTQGFILMEATLEPGCQSGRKHLRLVVINEQWRDECEVHQRLASLLAFATPSNIETVTVVLDADSIKCQQYTFRQHDLTLYTCGKLSAAELRVLSPMSEVTCPGPCAETLFKKKELVFDWGLRPRFRTFFGAAQGKFKYALDLIFPMEGYIWNDLYWRFVPGWTPLSTAQGLGSYDILNPSRLLNVHSDLILYYQKRDFRVEQAFLQQALNLHPALYFRATAGIVDIAYAGLGSELLYYPVNSKWALGLEGGVWRKRAYSGWGFQSKLRKFPPGGIIASASQAEWFSYNVLPEYFLDLYYGFDFAPLSVKFSLGQFMAGDFGLKTELFRYFPSGLRLSLWYTVTNGNDKVNGTTYHDKGISFSMPLDIIFKETSRIRFGYAMSAWLRDVGYRLDFGRPLYPTIYEERHY